MAENCQIEGCPNLAKFALYQLNPDGSKVWLEDGLDIKLVRVSEMDKYF